MTGFGRTVWMVLGACAAVGLPAQGQMGQQPAAAQPVQGAGQGVPAPTMPGNGMQFLEQLQRMRAQAANGGQPGAMGLPAATTTKPMPGVPAGGSGTVTAMPALSSGALPPSLLDQPAAPAAIKIENAQLTVTANNASLTEVLRQVASRTGMQIEGAGRDERIFGTYGPGRAVDVLSALLYDSGYNVMMAGTGAAGAPQRLVLSARVEVPVGAAPSPNAAAASREEEDDEEPAAPPGVPPMLQRPAASTAANPNQPRTPQQMLEELQRMRQAQGSGQSSEPPTRDDNGNAQAPQSPGSSNQP